MTKGHLDQQQASILSTKTKPVTSHMATNQNNIKPVTSPPSDTPTVKTEYIYAGCQTATGQIYTNPTR
jgi:hypothetical protein